MRSEYTVYRQHAGGVWSGAGKSGQFLQRVRCREQVRDVCREEYVSLVNADIQKLKDEFQRYSSKNVSTCRAFVTWPVRKAWGGVKCLRENGVEYTVKHAVGKVLRLFGSKCRW